MCGKRYEQENQNKIIGKTNKKKPSRSCMLTHIETKTMNQSMSSCLLLFIANRQREKIE